MEQEAGRGCTLRHSARTISERGENTVRAKTVLLPLINARPNNAAPLIIFLGLTRDLCAKNKCGTKGAVGEKAEGVIHTCRYRCRTS